MPAPENLQSERLRFRTLRAIDAPMLFRMWTSDPETMRFLQWRPHEDETEAQGLFAQLEASIARREKSYYVVSDSVCTPIGVASLKIEDGCRAMLGFVVFRDFRRRGYATEIVRCLCDWALAQSEIFRVYALSDVENYASIAAMKRAGMEQEGVLRRWAIHPNLGSEPRDVVCLAIAKEPNKAPEPTPTAVTPHAMEMKVEQKKQIARCSEACGAPAAGVAHL